MRKNTWLAILCSIFVIMLLLGSTEVLPPMFSLVGLGGLIVMAYPPIFRMNERRQARTHELEMARLEAKKRV